MKKNDDVPTKKGSARLVGAVVATFFLILLLLGYLLVVKSGESSPTEVRGEDSSVVISQPKFNLSIKNGFFSGSFSNEDVNISFESECGGSIVTTPPQKPAVKKIEKKVQVQEKTISLNENENFLKFKNEIDRRFNEVNFRLSAVEKKVFSFENLWEEGGKTSPPTLPLPPAPTKSPTPRIKITTADCSPSRWQ